MRRRSARFIVSLVLSLLMEQLSGGASAEGVPPQPSPSSVNRKADLFLSGHVIGFFPQDKDLSVGGNRFPGTDVRGAIGAGVKLDVYPTFINRALGLEIEAFGLGGSVRAPRTASGTGTMQAQGSLVTVNTMYNLMLRYPGETVQPYIGVGGGTSTGILYNVNIASGNAGLTGGSGDVAFAYQFLGGVRTFITKKLFLFGEYKYFVTKYSWDNGGAENQLVKLDFQTHIVSGGIGWSF